VVPEFQFSTSNNLTFSFLQDMAAEEGLRTVPRWKAHTLTGNRKGTWNLLITKNWRMTFWVDRDEIEIIDLDYAEYHREVGMSEIAGIRMKSPAHPGGFVKSEIIEPLGLSVTAAAQALGVKVASSAVLARSNALAAGVSGVSMAAPPSRVATNPAPCPSAADARNRRPSSVMPTQTR
jgi:plasmid maintenance system killer protein